MKVLNLSGGATKACGHVGACEVLTSKGYQPDVISGISAGALVAVPIALGLYDELREFTTHITLDQIFSKSPITPRGKLSKTAYWRFVRRKESLGVMGSLKDTIKKIITPSLFHKYQTGAYPIVWIMAVDSGTGKRHFFNMKEVSYRDYLTLTVASASVPLASEKVRYNNLYLTDGGIRNGIISHWIMQKHQALITDSVSIFLRPENNQDLISQDWNPEQVEETLFRDLAILFNQITISDQKRETELSELYNINNTQLFIPRVTDFSFDTDPKSLQLLYQVAKNVAYQKFKEH